jgi:P-type Cu2+ transporter
VEVTGTGERTALANIMRLVEQAQTSRSRAQALADRAAFFLTLVAIVAGRRHACRMDRLGATGAFAVERVVAVLVIACPHALGLAVPLVIAISTTLGAQIGPARARPARSRRGSTPDDGGVRQDGHADARRVSGRRHRHRWQLNANEALRLAAAVERDSEHTIAQGIVKSAEEQN